MWVTTAASDDWFIGSGAALWQVPVSALVMVATVIALVRLIGLRSFSKMSSFDFAVTVSIASVIGSAVVSTVPIVSGATAVASLLGIQAIISWTRARRSTVRAAVDNRPLLLMAGSKMLEDNMRSARVTRDDLVAKLREANVSQLSDVHAVVLETTGDISVLHGEDALDRALLDGVRGGDAIGDDGPGDAGH